MMNLKDMVQGSLDGATEFDIGLLVTFERDLET